VVPTAKAKLLIVDDDPNVVEIIKKMLSRCDYDVRLAYDGDQAVSIAREFRPDCVVTGLIMPKMNGFAEANAILEFQPTCKFVFQTGMAHDAKIREGYERLGLDLRLLLPKPFTRPDLMQALALAGFPCTEGSP